MLLIILKPLVPLYMNSAVDNPARPAHQQVGSTSTNGVGPARVYKSPTMLSTNVAYPPRPVLGSAADLDVIMDHCDYSTGKVSTLVTSQGLWITRQVSMSATV